MRPLSSAAENAGMTSLREPAQLLLAAKHREQHIASAGILHCRQLGGDLLRRSIERVLLGAAALVRIGEHMRAALAPGRAGHAHRAPGVLGLTSQSSLGVRPIFRHIQLARHRDPHRIERSPVRLTLGAVQRYTLANLLGGRVLVEHEVEATLGRFADRWRAPGGHPERRVWSLRRRRLDDDVLEAPEAASV